MPDEGTLSPLEEQLAARPLPQPIVTLPTYTTADALALFARLLEAIGYHETRSALLREASQHSDALTQRAASISEVELRQHLALCLPSLATTVANATAAAAPSVIAPVDAAEAAAVALPAVAPLRVVTEAVPSQPRKAAPPFPGSAGAMSRKQANAFFSGSRPRELAPAGESAADAINGAAGAASAAAAAPVATPAHVAAYSEQQACAAPMSVQPETEPLEGDTSLAVDGNGAAEAPSPPPAHSPPADAKAQEAASPAASPPAMASPPTSPPHDVDKAGSEAAAEPDGGAPDPAAGGGSVQQGAGDFAEAAVEAIAQRLDMGGCASPTAGYVSQDEVAYTPSAMDADDPFSHSKAATPHSFRRASGPRRASSGKDAAEGDTLFDLLNDDDGDEAEDDGLQWKASPPSHHSKLGDRAPHTADAADAGDRGHGATSSRSRSRGRGSPRGDEARQAAADRPDGSHQRRSQSPARRHRDSRAVDRDRRHERRSRHGSHKRPAELETEELRRQAAKRIAGSSPARQKGGRHEQAHHQRLPREVEPHARQPGDRQPDSRQHRQQDESESRHRSDRQLTGRQPEAGSSREQQRHPREDHHPRTEDHKRHERDRATLRHSSRRASLRSPVGVDAEALRAIAAQHLAEKLPAAALHGSAKPAASPSKPAPAHEAPPAGQAAQRLQRDDGKAVPALPLMPLLASRSPPGPRGLDSPGPAHLAAPPVAAIGRYQQQDLPPLPQLPPPPPGEAPHQQPLGSQISSVLQRLLAPRTGAAGGQMQPSPDDIDVLHDDWMVAAAEKRHRAQLREQLQQQAAQEAEERAQVGTLPPPPQGLPPPPPLPAQPMHVTTDSRRLQNGHRSADNQSRHGEAVSSKSTAPERRRSSRWGPEPVRSGDAGRDRNRDSGRRQPAPAEEPAYMDTGAEAAAQLKKLAKGGSQAHGIGARPRPVPPAHRLSHASSPGKHGAEPASSSRARRSIQVDDRHEVARVAAVALLARKPEARIQGRGASPVEARRPLQGAPAVSTGTQQSERSIDGLVDTMPAGAGSAPAAAAAHVGDEPSQAAGVSHEIGASIHAVQSAQGPQHAPGPPAPPAQQLQPGALEHGQQQQQQQQQQPAAAPLSVERAQQDVPPPQPAQQQADVQGQPRPEPGSAQPQQPSQQQVVSPVLRLPEQQPPEEPAKQKLSDHLQQPTAQPQQPQPAKQVSQHKAQVETGDRQQQLHAERPPAATESQQEQQQPQAAVQQLQQQQQQQQRKRKEPVVFQPSPKAPAPVVVQPSQKNANPAAPAAKTQPAGRKGAAGKKAAAGKRPAGGTKGKAVAGRKRGLDQASESDAPASAGGKPAPPRQSALKRLKQSEPAPAPAANGSRKQAAAPAAAAKGSQPPRQSALNRLRGGPSLSAPCVRGKETGRPPAAAAQQRSTYVPTNVAAAVATPDKTGGQQLQRKGKQPIVFMPRDKQ